MSKRAVSALCFIIGLMILGGCGGGGGSGSATTGTGTVALDIADAKPFMDGVQQPDELWIIFDSVSVHTSGGGWVSLAMPETPFKVNLLAFNDGKTTEFATPTRIPAGHVTQIRLEISRAYMVFYGTQDTTEEIDLGVPSGTLRTDKQIDWTLSDGGALSLTVHFDLSQCIVRSGQRYHLKPVLHLFNNDPVEAATICASVTPESFVGVDPQKVEVLVTWFESEADIVGQPFTHVTVPKKSETDATDFCIYWLVPLDAGESYGILIDNGVSDYYEVVTDLESGVTVQLNSGTTISIPVI